MLAFSAGAGLSVPRAVPQRAALCAPHRAPQLARISRGAFTAGGSLRRARAARTAPAAAPKMRFSGSGGGRGGGVPAGERALGSLAYLLPVLDALSFGRFVFAAAPGAANLLLAPLLPLYQVYRGVPFVAFGVFLALYVLVVRNSRVPRFVRFNVYQALLIDIALIVPQLLSGLRLGAAVPPQLVELASSAVFYAVALAVGYAVAANARGNIPDQIPGVSNAVYSQMGPY